MLELADILGQDIAAIQIERAMYVEAADSGQIELFAKDMLVRALRARLPDGWQVGADFLSEAAGAFAAWKGTMNEQFSAAIVRMWHWLKAADIPPEWLPEGPSDPIVERAFAEVHFMNDGDRADS